MGKASLPQLNSYDYQILEKDDQGKLKWIANEVRKGAKTLFTALIERGKQLKTAHDIFAQYEGINVQKEFSKYAEAECQVSRTEAYYEVQIFEAFGAYKSADVVGIDMRALRLLSKPEIPATARREAIRRAQSGTHVNETTAKTIVDAKSTKTKSSSSGASGKSKSGSKGGAKSGGGQKAGNKPSAAPTATETPQDSGNGSSVTQDPDAVDGGSEAQGSDEAFDQMNIQQCIDAWNKSVDGAIRDIQQAVKGLPENHWLNAKLKAIYQDQFKAAYATIRSAKAAGPCPHCKGDGCDACGDCGWMPKNQLQSHGGSKS